MADSTEIKPGTTKPKAPRKPRTPKVAAIAAPMPAAPAKRGRKPKSVSAATPVSAPKPRARSKAAVKAKVAGNGRDWRAQADQIKTTAAKTARTAAETGKAKAGVALHSLSRLITDTAGTVDEKMGPQYGDYARYAAEAVAGTATALDDRDLDQLMNEARDFVRKSPAVAIGAAAVLGFVLMRLAKGSDKAGK